MVQKHSSISSEVLKSRPQQCDKYATKSPARRSSPHPSPEKRREPPCAWAPEPKPRHFRKRQTISDDCCRTHHLWSLAGFGSASGDFPVVVPDVRRVSKCVADMMQMQKARNAPNSPRPPSESRPHGIIHEEKQLIILNNYSLFSTRAARNYCIPVAFSL